MNIAFEFFSVTFSAQPLHLHLPNKYKSKLKDAKNSIN